MSLPAGRPRARDLGLDLGELPPGPLDAITDVPGVQVGHATVTAAAAPAAAGLQPGGAIRTGVSVVLPHPGNHFRQKVPAAVHVINGFGKAAGFTQVEELGVLETPVALTGTLSVGAVHEGLVRHALAANPEIGRSAGTVNPVVAECSDARLSDIRALAVRPHHVLDAVAAAAPGQVPEGSVGAGTGMICYGWKGGIGTASRIAGPEDFVVGALVLANFGSGRDLRIGGVPVGRWLQPPAPAPRESGSCVVVLATSAPADARQLGRLARRAQYGLARTGTFGAHGSGDYVIAFCAGDRLGHAPAGSISGSGSIAEDGQVIDGLFRAVAESVEEAVINALLQADTADPDVAAIAPPIPVGRLAEIIGSR